MEAHGGRLAVEVLQRHDIDTMFTLSGGHLFVLYDGAVQTGLRLVDVPVVAQDDPRAQIYIVDHLAPGAVVHRRIEVSNSTASGARVAL